MGEERWQRARLIPTWGISGAEEAERRATSAFLSVLGAVREFQRTLLTPLGAPVGQVETFVEVPFELDGRRLFPDGLIRVTRGKKEWVALVEVKTGNNDLDPEQLNAYLDIARANNIDALITISNQIPSQPGSHPAPIDKRKLRKVSLHHWSWAKVITDAVVQKEHRGVADPDQAWILGELIRYLEHRSSGALAFTDMGDAWTKVRDAVRESSLAGMTNEMSAVALKFDALIAYASLRLGRRLGDEVTPFLTKQELLNPASRSDHLVQTLRSGGTMSGAIRVPHDAGPLSLVADLRASQITCFVDVAAPTEGRPLTRIKWLLKQFPTAPDGLRIDCFARYARGASTTAVLKAAREDPAVLVPSAQADIRSFRVARTTTMGTKRGDGQGSFIASVVDLVEAFYADVVSGLKPWSGKPTPLRTIDPEDLPVGDGSGDLSSQDGPDTSPAPSPFLRAENSHASWFAAPNNRSDADAGGTSDAGPQETQGASA